MKLIFANIFLALAAYASANKIIVTCADQALNTGTFVIDMYNIDQTNERSTVTCSPGEVFEFQLEKEFYAGKVKGLTSTNAFFTIESEDASGIRKFWSYENEMEFHNTENLAASSALRGIMRRKCANDENVACCSIDSGIVNGYCEITPKREIREENKNGPFKVDIQCADDEGNTGVAVVDLFWKDPSLEKVSINGVYMSGGTIPRRYGERVKFQCAPGKSFTFDLYADFFTGRVKGLTPTPTKFTIQATIGDKTEFMNYENSIEFYGMSNNLVTSSGTRGVLARDCTNGPDESCCSLNSGQNNGYCELSFANRGNSDGGDDIIEPITVAPVTEAVVETTAAQEEEQVPECVECLIDDDEDNEPEFDGGPTDAECRRKSKIPVDRDDIECFVTEKNRCKCRKVRGPPKNKERSRCLKGLKKDRCMFIRNCFFTRKQVLLTKCPDICEGAVDNYAEDVADMCKKTLRYTENEDGFDLCNGKVRKQKCKSFNPYPSDW